MPDSRPYVVSDGETRFVLGREFFFSLKRSPPPVFSLFLVLSRRPPPRCGFDLTGFSADAFIFVSCALALPLPDSVRFRVTRSPLRVPCG